MSYYHSLKRLIQGWWKKLQENKAKQKEKRKNKKKKKNLKHMGHWKSLVTAEGGEQEQLRCPYACRPSQALLCCSSTTLASEAYPDLPFSCCGTDYWLHPANSHMCITPLKLHSLTNDKECKGTRHCILCSRDHLFSAVSSWGSQNLVLRKTFSDTSDNTAHKHKVT